MKCKQLLSVMLVLCMLASSLAAVAAPKFDAKYECSSILFGYEEGEAWTDAPALEGGKTLTGKVTVKNSGDEENMVFSMFIYKNGKMVDGEVKNLPVGSTDVEFKASVEVPQEVEGCQVVAVLWNNFYDMKMICDSALFPTTSTKLRGLYIDGVAVEGFDPDVTEYLYAIDPSAEKYPEITWKTTDSAAKVTLQDPKSFPGVSVVSVESPDGQKNEYKIKYDSALGDVVTNVGGEGAGIVFVKGGMQVGNVAYNDRSYTITEISDVAYEGADLIQGSISWQTDSTFKNTANYIDNWITFDINRGVTVKVLKSDVGATAHFIAEGFTLEQTDNETGFVQSTTNVIKNHKVAMSKHFSAGETVKIPSGMSSTTYLVAIIHDPLGYVPEGGDEPDEPQEPADETLKLSSISIDGVELADFDADTTEYSYILSAEQLKAVNAPEVTCTLADQTSTAVVTTPSSFPGSAVITVTNAEGETIDYVINYDSRNIVANLAPDAAEAKNGVFVPGGIALGGRVASDRMQLSNWAINKIIPALDGQDAILTPVDDWNGVVNTFSFDLNRNATITVIQNKVNMLSSYEGFVANEDITSNKIVIGNNNGAGQEGLEIREYKFMASKDFEAGKVTLPYTKPNMPTLVAIKYVPWGNASAGDVSLKLESISIDGVAVEDFDKDIKEYDVVLTDAQIAALAAPRVTYTLADDESSAVVTNPTKFPGKAVITITNKDGDTEDYAVNYTATPISGLALNATLPENTPLPVYDTDFRVGLPVFADRATTFLVTEINDEFAIGKDRLKLCTGWRFDEKPYCDIYLGSTVINDWVSFTAIRDTIVTVYEDAEIDQFYAGYEKEVATDKAFVVAPYGTSPLEYDVKYSKVYKAGTKVELPNANKSKRTGMVVLTYPDWGESFEEGEIPDVPVIPDEPDEPDDPEEPEEGLEIMKVKDGKDSIVVFVHDDGDYATAAYLKDAFTMNGLKGSVGLIAKNINDTNKATWQELFDSGVLSAESHSMTHSYMGQDNTKAESAMVNGTQMDIPVGKMEDEIVGSQTKLRQLFPDERVLVYIRPGVGTITDMEGNPLTSTSPMAMQMMKDNYIAARVTGRTAYTKQGVDTIPPTDYYGMYSIMPGSTTTAEDMMASVDEAVAENGILVFCFHGIADTASSDLTTRKSEANVVFESVGEYVTENKVWNPFYYEAVLYMKEAETATATFETAGDNIEVTATDELDDAIYNYPVTVKVPVPHDWEYVVLTQGERTEVNVKTFTEGDETFVYANVVPDAGKATLAKSELIVDDLALSSIKIDGAEINGFKEENTEYSYKLTPSQVASVEAPNVTYTLADAENSSAVVTNPTEFPGAVTITVTNKDSQTRTYTVKYISDAVLTDITVADASARNADFVSGGFVVGGKPYYNRTYTIQEINDESLVGKDFFMGNIEWQSNATFKSETYTPWITLNAQRGVTVNILKTEDNGSADMVANGFTRKVSDNANGFVRADTNGEKIFKYSYTKDFETGEVVIPNGMASKAYFVVFSYAPWGVEDGEESEEPFYDQSIDITPFDGDILVSGSFKANTEEGKGYYVVLESYEGDNLVKTEKSDKIDLANGKNTFNISFAPSFTVQNTKAYVEAEDGTVICQPEELTVKTLKHLFIGNSFSVNAHKHLYEIAEDAGFNNIVLGTVYKGGCSLETHADYAENNTAGYTYYKNTTGTWNTTGDATMLQCIKDEDWMTISMQQASASSYKPDTYEPYLSELIEYVEDNKTNPDAKFVWHMTWAYTEEKCSSAGSQKAMYEGIVSAVQSKVISTDKFDIIIPSGTAIQNARTSTVGDTLNSDGTHLETIHGCYIAGLMTFKALTGEDISGITYDPGFTHDNFLAIAKESVNNAYAKPFEVTNSVYKPAEEATVSAIKIDGVAVENFDEETTEYSVTLTDDQLASDTYPEVTCELNGTEATADVTNPVSFPGFAEVKVTKGTEEKTYKINYVVPELQVNLTDDAPEGTPKATVLSAMTVGTPVFSDRNTFPVEAINDPDIEGALWLRSASGWRNDQKDYRDLYMGAAISDWVSFEVKRGAVVTVYEDSTSNTSRFGYWTTEASEETPYIKATHATPLNYIAKHQRYFAPGETVEIPNLIGARLYTATIKYLGWGEEAPELDVVVPEVKRISYSDLIPKITNGANANVEPGMWNGMTSNKSTKYQLSKEFADITEPTEITLTTDKIAKGYGIIVVAPLNETDDKNVIVNPDGSELEWTEYRHIVTDYAYTNDGDEDFNAENATFGMYNDTAATYTGGTAYVYANMNNSDDMYITGSALATNRVPYTGELHWTDLPEEYLGCNYIVVPFDTGFNGGVREFTFTVNQPVKIYVHSSTSDMTVTDTISDDAWTSSQHAVTRRYQNVQDHLTCAYMIKKGYINTSNIVFDGKVGSSNGVRFNRYDVYEKLKADCGSTVGWVIDPEKAEATGFTSSINDYRYEEYLEAWVD